MNLFWVSIMTNYYQYYARLSSALLFRKWEINLVKQPYNLTDYC